MIVRCYKFSLLRARLMLFHWALVWIGRQSGLLFLRRLFHKVSLLANLQVGIDVGFAGFKTFVEYVECVFEEMKLLKNRKRSGDILRFRAGIRSANHRLSKMWTCGGIGEQVYNRKLVSAASRNLRKGGQQTEICVESSLCNIRRYKAVIAAENYARHGDVSIGNHAAFPSQRTKSIQVMLS